MNVSTCAGIVRSFVLFCSFSIGDERDGIQRTDVNHRYVSHYITWLFIPGYVTFPERLADGQNP
jgi:hypothetical protein